MQKYHAMKKEMVLRELGTEPATGLLAKEAEKRLRENGANELTEKKKKSLLRRFFVGEVLLKGLRGEEITGRYLLPCAVYPS